jgi:hypothetical protein
MRLVRRFTVRAWLTVGFYSTHPWSIRNRQLAVAIATVIRKPTSRGGLALDFFSRKLKNQANATLPLQGKAPVAVSKALKAGVSPNHKMPDISQVCHDCKRLDSRVVSHLKFASESNANSSARVSSR